MSSDFKLPEGTPVLVTGATGFTGSVLTRKLVRGGARVRAVARRSSNIDALADLPVEWIRGEVYDEDVVRKACEGVHYIFHVAAAFRQAKISDEQYRRVHVSSTELLANRAADNPDFKRFIHVSTIGVHSHIENPPADENYPMQPGDIYQQTKAEGEMWIKNFSEQHGLPLVIVRPAAIYGPGDRRLLKLFRMAGKKVFFILGFGKNLFHLIHVDDLTDFFIHVALVPEAEGQIYICGNSEWTNLKEMVDIIARTYGSEVHFIRLPAAPFFAAGFLAEAVCRPLGIEPPIYRRRVAFFTKDRAFDTTKMRVEAGFAPKYNNEQGLKQTALWYVEQGWIKKAVS